MLNQGGRKQPMKKSLGYASWFMFVSYYLHKFLKLYVSQTKNCLNSCFFLLIFLFRSLFLLLIQQLLFKVFFKVSRLIFRVLIGGFLFYSRKRKVSGNNHQLSLVLPLVVPLDVIRFHLSSLVVLLVATCCHPSSIVITGLSLYKQSQINMCQLLQF